jgi:DNA-directed RNA polymerase subunit RPC12/RpoP
MILAGVVLLAWCGLKFYTSRQETKTKSAITDSGRCPDCGTPLPKTAQISGECPTCTMRLGAEGAKAARDRRQGKSVLTSATIPITLITVEVLLVATHLFVILRRRVGKGREEPTYFYICPKCGRKLRYRQRQIGHGGKCPLCRRVFLFPRPLDMDDNRSLLQKAASLARNLFSRKAPNA